MTCIHEGPRLPEDLYVSNVDVDASKHSEVHRITFEGKVAKETFEAFELFPRDQQRIFLDILPKIIEDHPIHDGNNQFYVPGVFLELCQDLNLNRYQSFKEAYLISF